MYYKVNVIEYFIFVPAKTEEEVYDYLKDMTNNPYLYVECYVEDHIEVGVS